MRLTLSRQFVIIGVLFAAIDLATIGLGAWSGIRLTADVLQLKTEATALYNHAMLDMGHDSLLGVVRGARLAAVTKDETGIKEAKEDLARFAGNMRRFIAANEQLELREQTRRQIRELRAPIDSYIRGAEEMVLLAERDHEAARGRSDQFEKEFKKLEIALEIAGKNINDSFADISARSETFARQLLILLGSMALGVVMLGVGVNIVTRRWVSEPLMRATTALDRATKGESVEAQPEVNGGAVEIEQLRHALLAFGDAQRERDRLQEEALVAERQKKAKVRATLAATERFRGEVVGIAGILAKSTETLHQVTTALNTTSRRVSLTADFVASSGSTSADSASQVAAASTELSYSAKEVAERTASSTYVAQLANEMGSAVDQRVADLGAMVDRIGSAVAIIDGIATKTKLLALNATIEAARAGESGRGFAVVAGEVKALSAQTGQVTIDIERHIADIRRGADATIDAIHSFTSASSNLSNTSTSLATVLEEQQQALAEITRAASKSADLARMVDTEAGDLKRVAEQSATSADNASLAAVDLSAIADRLHSAVEMFLREAA